MKYLVFIGLCIALSAVPTTATFCNGQSTGTIDDVACPDGWSCCKYGWSTSKGQFGCCPFENAVCCPAGTLNDDSMGYTCCPEGHTCQNTGSGWGTVTTCVQSSEEVTEASVPGKQICKIGAQFAMNTTVPNVVIAGDSVSIGYTPFVASMMEKTAFVQHTPWSGDGGWCETAYTLQCLDRFLTHPDGSAFYPDVLVFNSGLHNLLTQGSGVPGQSGNTTVYGPELHQITARMSTWAKANNVKLLYLLTSAYLCDPATDDIVVSLNKQAAEIMAEFDIPTANLHDAIVNKCGPPPVTECFGVHNCFCPHCPGANAGYPFLAETVIIPAINKLLGL